MCMQVCAVVLLLIVVCCTAAVGAVLPLDKPGMGVKVEAGAYAVLGHKVKVAKTVEVAIGAPERVVVKREAVAISEGQPGTWAYGAYLEKTKGPVDTYSRYPNMLDPMSVNVYLEPTGGEPLQEGKDYALDHFWGGIARVEGGRIAKDATVYADYTVLRERIDIIQVSADGSVSCKAGVSGVANVVAPEADKGSVVLANVYVPFRTQSISESSIYPLPAKSISWTAFTKTSGRERLKHTLGLLKAKKPVSVVCWGDSVTCGGSSSKPENSYVELFRARLAKAYPGTPITLTNAGIGGSNTDSRRDGFDKEVLAFNPDLITMEFVNDVGLGADKIKANYVEFITKARQKNPNVEFVIITPHLIMPAWMGGFQAAIAAMREAAGQNKVALCDTTNTWDNLRLVGIPYETLLANGINHPNDLGHEFFADGLMQLLKP